jgi:hypothetical protein
VAWTRAALALVVAGAVALALVSGGSSADPRTPAGLPGLPPPFLGTAIVGGGALTAAIDAYGDVVDLRTPGPAGRALVDNSAARQAAGTVAADTGIVPRVRIGAGPALPLWRADRVSQRYRPGTNVMVTRAQFGSTRVEIVYAIAGDAFGCLTAAPAGSRVSFEAADRLLAARLRCDDPAARRILRTAAGSDRRWLSQAEPLGGGAPRWARALYKRSLLTLRALTDRRTGAVTAGARDGWAYVWPRDAATAALALVAAGYRTDARRAARFLLGLDLGAAARFRGDGTPVPGRAAQGDAEGWTAVAARAAGLPFRQPASPWRDRADYREGAPGDYLANAIAATGTTAHTPAAAGEPARSAVDGPETHLYGVKSAHRTESERVEGEFGERGGLGRSEGPGAGLDSAAAWAVRPFALPALFPAARRTLLALASQQTRFGITPGADWPGTDPWTAPTAWSAWSLAALSDRQRRAGSAGPARRDRRAALRLLGDLHRAATPAGALPERVEARSGVPASTTPLAWSHAFAILALRQLWP